MAMDDQGKFSRRDIAPPWEGRARKTEPFFCAHYPSIRLFFHEKECDLVLNKGVL